MPHSRRTRRWRGSWALEGILRRARNVLPARRLLSSTDELSGMKPPMLSGRVMPCVHRELASGTALVGAQRSPC